jgi:hypothetical protein
MAVLLTTGRRPPKRSKWYQLEVPFVDAMYLLSLLQGAKDDVGYKEPVEAPAPEKY